MRKVKHSLLAVVVAASALVIGAAPPPLAAESTTSTASAAIADGWYLVVDANQQPVGWVYYTNGVVTDQCEYIEVVGRRTSSTSQ